MRALLLLVSACWSGSAAPPTPPLAAREPPASPRAFRVAPERTSCEVTISTLADKLRPDVGKTGFPAATFDELVEVAIASCRDTAWSSELLACYDGVDAPDALTSCQSLMTTEQSEDFSQRVVEVMTHAAPPGGTLVP